MTTTRTNPLDASTTLLRRSRKTRRRPGRIVGEAQTWQGQTLQWWHRHYELLLNGRYALGPLIGQGSFKQSHLALDIVTEDRVVVSRFFEPAETAERFIQRYLAVRDLGEHENLLQVLTAGIAEGGGEDGESVVYVVSEPIRRSLPLGQRMFADGRPLPVPVILRFLYGALAALHHLHNNNLIHGTPHLNNCLISRDGVCVVADFDWVAPPGTSRLASDAVAEVYAPHWTTPEQLRGEPHREASDLFVLGIAAYVAATARFPFADTLYIDQSEEGGAGSYDFLALLSRLPVAPAAINPAIPQRLSDLVIQMLIPDPACRIASAADALAQLGQIAFHYPGMEASRAISEQE